MGKFRTRMTYAGMKYFWQRPDTVIEFKDRRLRTAVCLVVLHVSQA